ncbi:MAG: hypothetical protein WC441_04970 [Patescibacteria group bacterium]
MFRLESAERRFKGHYAALHEARVEYHCQRVAGDEKLMRKYGINR